MNWTSKAVHYLQNIFIERVLNCRAIRADGIETLSANSLAQEASEGFNIKSPTEIVNVCKIDVLNSVMF